MTDMSLSEIIRDTGIDLWKTRRKSYMNYTFSITVNDRLIHISTVLQNTKLYEINERKVFNSKQEESPFLSVERRS